MVDVGLQTRWTIWGTLKQWCVRQKCRNAERQSFKHMFVFAEVVNILRTRGAGTGRFLAQAACFRDDAARNAADIVRLISKRVIRLSQNRAGTATAGH
jgi:hypothetical protein